MARWIVSVAIAVAAVAQFACGSTPPLEHGLPSSDALAAAVLDAISKNDRARLDQLALREREFRDHVWPELPAARPERNLPFSYVWGDLHQKSNLRLSATLKEHGGKRYLLKHIKFAGQTQYGDYLVHRDAAFEVVDGSDGLRTIRVCGSLLEKNGVWKVFSYVVD